MIVPIFNGMPYLPAFFESLAAALPDRSEVILIDDASTEPVFETVPSLPRADSVTQLRNDTNVGYSAAVNRAFSVATGDVVVQLNTDLLLEPAAIDAMIHLIGRERDVGLVGSKLIYPTTGRVQSVGMAFGDHTKKHIYRYLPADHPLCCRTRDFQIVTGATVAMTRRVLNLLGPLDERFYNHNDDLDHCMRAVASGLRNFTCAESVAHHWRSQSGPARYARVEAAEALFWATWGGLIKPDLARFVDEALVHVLDNYPDVADVPFEVVDLSRGADQAIVLECLETRWPGIRRRVRNHRQLNNPASPLWLPLVLPHWMQSTPIPLLYLVDSHRDLDENALWFERRHQLVREELIVDLTGASLPTTEVYRT